MPKNKFSAALSLVLVFASGILVGAVSYRLFAVSTVATAPRRSPEEVRKQRMREMRDRVKLDDTQFVKLGDIYDHTFQEFQALKKKGDEEARQLRDHQRAAIREMLRPDQLPLYEQYQKELDEAHKKRMAEGKK